MKAHVRKLKQMEACQLACEYAARFRSMRAAWVNCQHAPWLLWYLKRKAVLTAFIEKILPRKQWTSDLQFYIEDSYPWSLSLLAELNRILGKRHLTCNRIRKYFPEPPR